MEFDRNGIGGGITVFSQLENGKAELEITAYINIKKQNGSSENREVYQSSDSLQEDGNKEIKLSCTVGTGQTAEFRIFDGKHQEIGSICTVPEEVCTVKTILIHPHLWQSVEDPYVYTIKAFLLMEGRIQDEIEITHAIRTFQYLPIKGYCLNQKPFWLQAVRYIPPYCGNELDEMTLKEEIQCLKDLGANTICLKETCQYLKFYQICDESGFVIWKETDQEVSARNRIPDWSGPNGLFSRERKMKRDNFYYYKACWSKEPFIYICGHEEFQKSTDIISVRVYSNQKKAALYVDGILFEFKESTPVFLFEDVPLRTDTIVTAQAGEWFYSVTWKRTVLLS